MLLQPTNTPTIRHHVSLFLLPSSSVPRHPNSLRPPPTTLNRRQSLIICSVSQVNNYGTVDYEKRPMPTWHTVYKRISLTEDQTDAGSVLDEFERDARFKLNKWKLFRVVKELRKFRRYSHALQATNADAAQSFHEDTEDRTTAMSVSAISVLDEWERKDRFKLNKWKLFIVVKELRKLGRHNHALQVYEWMNARAERFIMSTSDIAIQLDLTAKVHGAEKAKDYFFNLSDTVKDKRTYGALLNAYVQAKMRDQAESLMKVMQEKGYATNSLPFNLMMTLYLNLKEYDKVEPVISIMKGKSIRLDIYSYNIWISSCGYQGSVEKMEQALELMKKDESIIPNWSTFSTLATMYIKLGDMEKASSCLKMVETRITGRDRIPYHYLISLYSSVGQKDEVYRVWNAYKSTFASVVNLGYQTMVSSLVRLDDIEGAKEIYKEWVSVQSSFDPRITNVLMGWYVREGQLEKARVLFDDMVELGGKGNSLTWEILAEAEIRERRVSQALSFLKEAALADRSKRWKPKPVNVSSILKLCKEGDDVASEEVLIGILRGTGCFEDEAYMSYIPLTNGVASNVNESFIEKNRNDDKDEGVEAADDMFLNQLQESL